MILILSKFKANGKVKDIYDYLVFMILEFWVLLALLSKKVLAGILQAINFPITDWLWFYISNTGADELNDKFGDALKLNILSAIFVANRVQAGFSISDNYFPLSQTTEPKQGDKNCSPLLFVSNSFSI